MRAKSVTLFVTAFLCLSPFANAQGRGGHASTATAHVAAGSRVAAPAVRGPVRPGPAPIYSRPGRVAPFSVARRPVVVPVVPYYAPYYYSPYYGGGYYGSSYYGGDYDSAYSTSYPNQYAPPTPVPDSTDYSGTYAGADLNDLNNEIQQLSAEVEQLRADQESQTGATPDAPRPSADAVPTILVFKDGHRMEIHNYAVTGDTLWVLTDRSSTSIALSDLDLQATQAVNRTNGVRFLLPQ